MAQRFTTTVKRAVASQNAGFFDPIVQSPLVRKLDGFLLDADVEGLREMALAVRYELGRHHSTRDECQREFVQIAALLCKEGAATLPLGLSLRAKAIGLLIRHPRLRTKEF